MSQKRYGVRVGSLQRILEPALLTPTLASKDPSETAVDEPTPEQDDPPPNTLRRRKPRIRGYSLDTDDENEDEDEDDEAASIESSYPSTPRDDYFPPIPDLDKPALDPTILGSADTDRDGTHSAREPDLLPRYTESVERLPLSWGERVLDRVAPYAELREAERVLSEHARTERFDKVLARLLTEWYVVAASVSELRELYVVSECDEFVCVVARPRGYRCCDLWPRAWFDIPR